MSALGGGLSGAAGELKNVYHTFLVPHLFIFSFFKFRDG